MLEQVAIYIPAFNAASTVPKVLDRIPSNLKQHVAEIFVVDNNSTDNTHLVVIGYKQTQDVHNLEVVRNPQNLGYGGSQKVAYRRCIEKGYKCVAMLHGDAQYAPELLETLIEPILKGEADMVFGSRMSGDPRAGGMPLYKYMGNRFLTWMQNRFLGTNLTEFHSGYRVFSVDALKKISFERLSSDFHFDTEIIISFVFNKLRIVEKPIPTHYGDEENYVNVWKYGKDVLVTTFTYFLHVRGYRKSVNWTRILGS